MPVDANGNSSRPPSPIPVTGQNADAPQVNVPVDDIYSILNLLMFLDGRKAWRGDQSANGYKIADAADGTDPQDYVTKAQLEAAVSSVASIPTGAMMFMASTVIPTGWLALNGQTVSRTTYAALWAYAQASGNLAATEGAKTAGQFGPGNGATTFTLPNLYADGGYFIRPTSSGRGIGSVQADEIRSHGHSASFSGNPVPNHTHQGLGISSSGGNVFGNGGYGTTTSATSAAGGHTPSGTVTVNATGGTETRPKNIAYPVLIKT